MANQAMIILVATAIIMAYWSIPTTAQTGCTAAIISLAPCLSYITGNSPTPPASCCSQLGNIVQSQPQCLCTVLNGGGSSFGISLNKTQALALPGACKVQTPPVSRCNAGSGGSTTTPAKAPVAAPRSPTSPSSNLTPSTSPSNTTAPSANGSKSNNGDSSNGGSNKSFVLIMVTTAVIFASCF